MSGKTSPKTWLIFVAVFVVAAVGYFGFRSFQRWQRDARTRPEIASDHDQTSSHVGGEESRYAKPDGDLAWGRFRGPNGTGIYRGAPIPTHWSQDANIKWSVALPGRGSSSPVLARDAVFVTCYTGTREDTGQMSDLARHLVCIDRESGATRWTVEDPSRHPEDPSIGMGIPEHGYATSTPVTDGERVFVFYGKSGVIAYDMSGTQLWRADLGQGSNEKGWGSCASPILVNDLVVVNAAEECGALVALDKATGEVRWRAEGLRLPFSFSTPAIVEREGGSEIVAAVLGEIWGISAATGKLLWYAKSPIHGNVSPCIIVDGERVFAFGGFRDVGSICVRAGGRGDVTDSHVVWTSKLTSYVGTPVLVDNKLFWVDDNGKYFCADAETGEALQRARMPSELGGGRPVYASMVAAGDRILVQSRYEGVFSLSTDPKLSVLDHNRTDDDSMANATPAIDRGELYLRSDQFLHCIASGD